MLRRFSFLTLSFFISFGISAQTIVHTSEELRDILAQDKEVGVVLLDGDWFHIDGAIVNMGGTIKPYRNRKPVLVGFQQTVNRNKGAKVEDGYWTAKINGYGAANYIFLDQDFNVIERTKTVDGKKYMLIKASDLQRTDKESRIVRIKVPSGYGYLLNKSAETLRNAMLKVGYWFVQMNIYNLHSDGIYLYGQIDNAYNYNLLDKRPNSTIQINFFNFPVSDGGIYLDGNNVLHVPAGNNAVRMCCSSSILNLCGSRNLAIEGISFAGSMKPIVIKGTNKHIYNCTFKNCGSGVYCDYGVKNKEGNCSVNHCRFENMYNNDVITFVGCDDVLISNNFIHNAGMVNRGGSVIRVGGNNFKVEHNEIRCYSYIAINAGLTREYAAAKVSGIIKDNLIDNIENLGKADKQLTDGGGIYVITHTDGVAVENNIVRNIGYEGCELWGIYLDDGAYNCTVRRNLVYNLWPGQYALTARYVDECEHSCMNNIVENNILVGPCKIAGNRKGFGNKTIIRNNYISGDLNTQGDEYVNLEDNKFVSAMVGKDGRIVSEKGNRIKKRGFTRNIKRLIKR